MDSIKYYVAISAACAFTLTPCSAKEAMGEALLHAKPAASRPAAMPAAASAPAQDAAAVPTTR